jgi:hypothetical protein
MSVGFNVAFAAENDANPSPAGPSAGKIYRNSKYGFQLRVPDGWTARETDSEVAHYLQLVLTINSRRPELEIREWPIRGNETSFGPEATFQQMQPGEVYISLTQPGGPFIDTMWPDTIGNDLRALLATNRISVSLKAGLSELNIGFFKRGHRWGISAYLREPITEESRRNVTAMLESFQFVDTPVESAGWAESLAWKELPEQVQFANTWDGWPVVELQGDEPASAMSGPREAAVKKSGSTFSVKFILRQIGTWEYLVGADGKVQSLAPRVNVVRVPSAQLPSDLPGSSKGVVNAYWVAPYVQASKFAGKTMFTWFTKEGTIKRQSLVDTTQPGFVSPAGQGETFLGVNEEWQIKLPSEPIEPGLAGYITSTSDSRVFFHERHPRHGLIALDVYVHGKLANTVGPFFQYVANDVALNEDGSSGLLISKDESRTIAQIVTLNTNGRVRLRVDCGAPVTPLIVAPDGTGALLRPNTGGTNVNTFMWFTEQGRLLSKDIYPNPWCVGWIPGTSKSLFWTSLGYESNRYQLIDWQIGKRLWDIPSPGERRALAVGITPSLIIFSVAQPNQPEGTKSQGPDDGKEWIRTLYAVSVQDGSLIAQWQAQLPHSPPVPDDHFVQLRDRLFYVTADDFTELNLEDIGSKRHGWR